MSSYNYSYTDRMDYIWVKITYENKFLFCELILFCRGFCKLSIIVKLITNIVAAQNEVALSYDKVRGLYFCGNYLWGDYSFLLYIEEVPNVTFMLYRYVTCNKCSYKYKT